MSNALKQAGIEGSEELATELSNIITDIAIMGDKSNYSLTVKNYMAQGMSEAEAKKAATGEMAWQVGLAFVGGTVSGGTIGSGAGVLSGYRTSQIGNNILSAETGEALVKNALTLPKNTDAFKLASQIREGSVKADAKTIGRLAVAYSEAGSDTAILQKASQEAARQEQIRQMPPEA